jgi:uncharacterized membrane protein YfcA
MYAIYLAIGLVVGLLVGFMGVGGGVLLVPAMVHILGMDQHMAQGTSLLMQLPPLGIGALMMYRKKGQVDLKAGVVCAVGILLGGDFGSNIAMRIASRHLHELFSLFLIVSAMLLWHKPDSEKSSQGAP